MSEVTVGDSAHRRAYTSIPYPTTADGSLSERTASMVSRARTANPPFQLSFGWSAALEAQGGNMSKFRCLAIVVVSLVFPSIAATAEFPVDRPVAEDTPATTVTGNPFTIPAGWSASIKGP